MDRAEALELFINGQTPYLISSSDGLQYARDKGLQVGVAAVPAFSRGEPARPMSLVHGLFMGLFAIKRGDRMTTRRSAWA